MNGQLLPFTEGLFFSAGITIFLAVYVQRWRETPGIHSFTAQLVFQAIWAASFAMETVIPDLPTKLLFRKLAWIGILGVPVCWMVFVFRYTNQDRWLTPLFYRVLVGVCGLLFFSALTNDFHNLFWSSAILDPGVGTGVVYGRGPLFWLSIGFDYALVVTAFVELLWVARQSTAIYRRQSILLVVSAFTPFLTSILFVLGLTGPNDYTPLGFALTSVIITWAIMRYRLFNLIPVARSRLLQTLPDGIVAIDAQNRVIDINPAFLRIAMVEGTPIGEGIEKLFCQFPDLLDALLDPNSSSGKTVLDPGSGHYYQLVISELEIRPGMPMGRLVILRDITETEKMLKALRISEENIRKLFDANPFPMAIIGVGHSNIFQVNQSLLEYLHLTREEIIGQRASKFYASPHAPALLANEIERAGFIRDWPIELKRPNGERCFVVLNAYPVDYYSESRWLVSFADITERQRLEEYEREQRLLAEVLRETSRMLSSSLDLDEVLDLILKSVVRVVRHDVANIILVNPQGIGYVARTQGYLEHGYDSPYGKVWLSIEDTPNLSQMVERRVPIIIPDVTRDPGWIAVPGTEWIRSHLGAPIFTQDGAVGFLNLDSAISGFFNQADAAQLQIFSEQAGLAIQNARLYTRIRKAAHESEVLQEIAQTVGSSLDFDIVIDKIFELISRLVPSDSVGVLMIEGDEVVLKFFRGMENSEALIGSRWKLATSVNQVGLEAGRPVNFPDVQAVDSGYSKPPHNMIRSVLMIPLIAGGQVIGFLTLDSFVLDHFTAEDERLADAFSRDIAVAVENSRLYKETQRRLKVQSILNEIGRAASSRLQFDDLLDLMWQQVNQYMDAGNFVVVAKGSGKDEWIRRYSRMAGVLQAQVPVKNRDGIVWYVIHNPRPIYLRDRNDVEQFERITGHKALIPTARSLMVVPLVVSERVIGVIAVLNDEHDFTYQQEDFDLFSSIATTVAVSMENARLFEETRRRAEELEILNRLGLAITSGLDFEHVLTTLYEQCTQVMPADTFYVALYNHVTGNIEFPLFYDQGIFRQVGPFNILENPGLTSWVLREKRTFYLKDSLDPEESGPYHLVRFGGVPTRSYVGVPLILRDQTVGVLSIQSTRPSAYSTEQVSLLETIAVQAAIAIENARLYQEAQLLATTDFLTGLLNRRELFSRAEQEFERARRYRHSLAVMMIDIDHFKLVNDTFGHLAGDQVLRLLSRVCQKNMRLVDVVGRYGGEEILIFMPETDREEAFTAAERLRIEIDEMIVSTDKGDVRVTVSVGLTSYNREKSQTLETLISRADDALFAAKAEGRNRVCVTSD